MKIIGADERLAEKRGAKILITGPTGVGKTELLRTVDPRRTLFLDAEAGDLSVRDVPVDTIRVDDWRTAVDLACRIGGPNPSFPPTSAYSAAHYEAVGGALPKPDPYDTIFVDSITEITRLSFRHAEQQPEATSARTGAKDTRAAYGLHGRQMVHWLQQLQHAREKNVVFVAVLEHVTDEFNRLHRVASATRGRQDRARAPRHRRSGRHHAVRRLRRRQASARLRVHVAEPVGISRKRSQRSARTTRAARSRQAHRKIDPGRSGAGESRLSKGECMMALRLQLCSPATRS